jgi:NAD(P)-dependent dehydrogenase (short-subunit alcohol dehydrogenase family)
MNVSALEGRRLLMVGVSPGIGRTAALRAVRIGATVVMCARRADKLSESVREPGGGVDLALTCSLIIDRKIQTKELLGESFPKARFEDALALAERRVDAKDAERASLEVS